MFEFLLSSSITCEDANAVVLRIQKHETLKAEWKIELIETIQDYTSECPWERKRLKERGVNPILQE